MTRSQFIALTLSALSVFAVGVASTTYAPGHTSTSASLPASVGLSEAQAEEPVRHDYVEITEACGPYFDGECLNVRTGPGLDYPVAFRLRAGVVLRVGEGVEREGRVWRSVVFDEWLRYPERVSGEYFIAAEHARVFADIGPQEISADTPASAKRIVVDRSEQMLYAYDSDVLFMQTPISTGLELTPTPRGTFTVFRKTPSRYMQGPIPGISEKVYDLPGVPWNLYFTEQGAVIHGAYWHDHFGEPWSNGCVNVPLDRAQELYRWADLGTSVTVRD